MDDQRQTIGLYGGSFNPPHLAHVLVAAWALAEGTIDRLWVIPTGGHPFGKALAPFEDRLEMCRRAFGIFGPRVEVVEVEREERIHYSVETLERLIREHPAVRWRWVLGSDTLAEAGQWRRFDDLARLAPLIVVPRQGYPAGAAEPAAAQDRFALPNLSSTWLRERLAEGAAEELTGLVPGPVLEWIARRGLYRKTSG